MNLPTEFVSIPDYEEQILKYPKSRELFNKWLLKKLTANIGHLGIEFANKEAVKLQEKTADTIATYDPRKLYDFFDENDVIISVIYHLDLKMFTYSNSQTNHSSTKPTRNEAEVAAFLEAFQTLENII